MGPMAGVGEMNPFGVIGVLAIWLAVSWFVLRWFAMWSPERVKARVADGMADAWRSHLCSARHELLVAFALRCEAETNLDGLGCGAADELARRALSELGGLAGVW